MANKSGASPQAVSLPVGGGDVRGLGESFQPDLNSGIGNYRVPLELLPGIANFQPTLALTYSTGAGNGPYGLGWNLPVASISRRTFRGYPSYDDASDVFLYGGASELVKVAPGRYRSSVEHGFERIVRLGAGWEVTEKAGIRHTIGTTLESRIEFVDEHGQIRVFAWLIDRTEDTSGNGITYHYRQEGSQRYLKEVRYAIYFVRLEYEARPDPFSEFRSGYELRTDLRCSGIAFHVDPVSPAALQTWRLEYVPAPLSGLSMLAAVTQSGFDPETGDTTNLPPLTMSYTKFDAQRRRLRRFASEVDAPPPGLDRPNFEVIDLDGKGLPGILGVENGAPRYWPNRGNLRWGPSRALRQFPAAFSLGEERIRFADMDGNGGADILVGSGTLSGYYENNGAGEWDAFVHYPRSPEFAFERGDLQLLDVNGDGLVDAIHAGRTGLQVYENHGGAGWGPPRLFPKGDSATAPPDLTSGDPRVRLADMNGDGTLDIVMIASGRIEYWSSRGNGRYAPGRVMSHSPRFPYPFDPSRVLLTDVDGDGLCDVVYADADEVLFWINQSGNGFSPPQVVRYTPPTSRPDTLRVADMTGTGTRGLLWTTPFPDYRYLDFTGGIKPGLLERIDNQCGRVTTIEYTTSTEQALADRKEGRPWASFLPFPVQVVAAVTIEDAGSGLHSVTHYRYHDGHYDGHRREFDGFARAEQMEIGDASMPTGRTIFDYHTESSARRLIADPNMRRSLKRKLYRVEVYGVDGSPGQDQPYRVEESSWAVRVEQVLADGGRILFPYIAETKTSVYEREASPRVERRVLTFDAFGNVVAEERHGEGNGAPPLFLKTTVEYASNVPDWVVDRPARIVQRDNAGHLLNETRHYYDGAPFQGLPLGQAARGHLSRTERIALRQADVGLYGSHVPNFAALGYVAGHDADGQATWNVDEERREADAHGNVVAKCDAVGNTTSYQFDAFGLFAISVTDAKGFVASVEHDYRVAKPRRMVNPNGGVTAARFDPLRRLSKIALPGDTLVLPTSSYHYDTGSVPPVRRTDYRLRSGQLPTVRIAEYLDGAGSVMQRRTEHEGNTFAVSGRLVSNARGKTAAKLEPYFASGSAFEAYVVNPSAPKRVFHYDALGRPIAVWNPDGGQSRAEYHAFSARFFDPGDTDTTSPLALDTPRVELYDAWQRLIAVQERGAATVNTTTYGLDPLGRLQQVTDARGVVLTHLTYDLLGRRIAIQHLDAGQRLIAYDAAGNTVATVDAAGTTIERSYDELNRLSTTAFGGATAERYDYDVGPGTNALGRLVRATDPSGETTFSYDARGNVIERTRTFAGQTGTFTVRYTYDRLGRITALTYPDNTTVDFDYGSGLLLRRIPGYIDNLEYTAAGIRAAIDYANGVRTEYDYDAATLRLGEVKTWRPATGEVYLHTGYTTSKVGNIQAIDDLRTGVTFDRTQHFTYDAFDQLTHADGTAAAGTYAHDYAYDAVGNVLRNPVLSPLPLVYAGGTTNRLRGFDNSGVTIDAFDHDANGNLTTMPGKTLSFDAKHQLERVQVAGGTDVRFLYDHRGMLAQRRLTGPGGPSTTLYIDSVYEVQDGTPVRWIFAGEFPIARASGSAKVFLHNDHLGSAVVYTDAAGNRLAETAYYPFGQVALAPAAGALPTFTTKRLDADIGLYYFHARWYAPDIGRFVSPDPLYLFEPEQGMQEPRRLNPYAYAGNNPVRFVDPTGLGFWDVLGAIAVAVAVVVAVVAVAVLTAGIGAAIGFGTLALYAGAAGLAGAAVGAIVGGIVYGSWEGALRGAMIGFTAGANALIGGMIFGPIVGAALGITTFLAIVPPIAKSDVYQGILGWTSYLMPMSWPGHALGVVVFSLNVLGYVFTLGKIDALKIHDVKVDWKTGTIATLGGWVGKLAPGGLPALTVGGFSFFDYDPSKGRTSIEAGLLDHEAGHMLNNGAFGWFQVFNVFGGGHDDKYFEKLAESNAPASRGYPRSDQWG